MEEADGKQKPEDVAAIHGPLATYILTPKEVVALKASLAKSQVQLQAFVEGQRRLNVALAQATESTRQMNKAFEGFPDVADLGRDDEGEEGVPIED